jgi:hypothetical protein
VKTRRVDMALASVDCDERGQRAGGVGGWRTIAQISRATRSRRWYRRCLAAQGRRRLGRRGGVVGIDYIALPLNRLDLSFASSSR